MKKRRLAVVMGWVLVVYVAVCMLGSWLADHGVGYVIEDRSEFSETRTFDGGVRVMAGLRRAQLWETSWLVPFVVHVRSEGDEYGLFASVFAPSERDGEFRLVAAEAVLAGETRALSLRDAEDPEGPAVSGWRPLYDYGRGREIDLFHPDELIVPETVDRVTIRVVFDLRFGDELRRVEARLEMPRRTWREQGFQFHWR